MAWLAPWPGRVLTSLIPGAARGALAPGFILPRLRRVKAKVYTMFRDSSDYFSGFMADIEAQSEMYKLQGRAIKPVRLARGTSELFKDNSLRSRYWRRARWPVAT